MTLINSATFLPVILYLLYWVECKCNVTITKTQITNFTDLLVNDFGYKQGLRLNNGGKRYERFGPNSSLANITTLDTYYANQELFFSETFSESDGRPFETSKMGIFEVEVLQPLVDFALVLCVELSASGSCKSNDIQKQCRWIKPWPNYIKAQGRLLISMDYQAEIGSHLENICGVEILDTYPYNMALSLVSLSVKTVVPTCRTESKPSDYQFVWKQSSALMFGGQPIKFASVVLSGFISSSPIEQEDLVRTVAAFSKSNIAVAKIGSLLNCFAKDMVTPNFNNRDCALLYKQPGLYKESAFQLLDRGMEIAGRFNVFVIVSLMPFIASMDPFSSSRMKSDLDLFFHDRQIIDDYKDFINFTLTRRNSKSGTTYKDDPTILGWSLGPFNYNICPPSVWVAEISDHIRSIDGNHLIILECNTTISYILTTLLWEYVDVVINPRYTDSNMLLQTFQSVDLSLIISESIYNSNPLEFFNQYTDLYDSKTGSPSFAGLIMESMSGRKEESGLKGALGLIYPGMGGPVESFAMKWIMNMSAILGGTNYSGSELAVSLEYAPRLLSLSYPSPGSMEFTWFGVAGAISYDVYRAIDNAPFTLLASNLSELSSKPIFTDKKLPNADICDIFVKYKIHAVNSGQYSPPLVFNISIKSKFGNENSDCDRKRSATYSQTSTTESSSLNAIMIAFIVLSAILALVSVIIILFYAIRNRRIKTFGPKSMVDEVDMKNMGSKTSLFKNSSESKTSIKTPKIPISKSKGSGKVSITFDETNTASITITLSNSIESKPLFVPGYLRFDWDTDIKQTKSLGKGATGIVYVANILNADIKERHGVSMAAVKSMPMVNEDSFLFEVAIHQLLSNCQNIVTFMGYFMNPYGMLLDLCDGTLSDIIFSDSSAFDKSFLNVKSIISAASDICQGCAHIHKHGVVHYDLKTANVLYKKTGVGFTFKVSDFGCAKLVNTDGYTGKNNRLVNGIRAPADFGYTYRYCSPEILELIHQSRARICSTSEHYKCDVYSYSIILYELVNGVKAWSDEKTVNILSAVLLGKRPQIIDRFKRFQNELAVDNDNESLSKLTRIIELCWSNDPGRRPDFKSILKSLNSDSHYTVELKVGDDSPTLSLNLALTNSDVEAGLDDTTKCQSLE